MPLVQAHASSARILAGLDFKALATSSGASAGPFGRLGGKVTRKGGKRLAAAGVLLHERRGMLQV